VALQHELRLARLGVPELNAAVLGAGKHPLGIGRERDAEDEILRRALVSIARTWGRCGCGAEPDIPGDPQMS
jgi:hypothetical protein